MGFLFSIFCVQLRFGDFANVWLNGEDLYKYIV